MFNLHQHKIKPLNILTYELNALGIIHKPNNTYKLTVGDETVDIDSLEDCKKFIRQGIDELKTYISDKWYDLSHLAESIVSKKSENVESLDNALFLNSVKKSIYLAGQFSQLSDILSSLKKLRYLEPSEINPDDIKKFNLLYLAIRACHYLILDETYRLRVIDQNLKIYKSAQISGPWANLDLPMKERIWEWDAGEEEYFAERTRARKEQPRYNPEYDKFGFYYVWSEPTRDPYLFVNRKVDSPYKQRAILQTG